MRKIVIAALLLPLTAHADGRRLTFKQAIETAIAQNPDIAQAKEAVGAERAKLAGAKAHELPVVSVNLVGNAYAKPYELPFGMDDKGNPIIFTLHERFVSVSSLTITQPLTGLAYLSELVGVAEHQVEQKKHEYDRARLDVAYRAAEGYIHVLQARASADVARKSVADIQSGLDRALQLRQADVYTDIDVLRFKSAKAAADLQLLKAQAGTENADAALAVLLGFHDGTALEIADDLPVAPPPLAMTVDAAQQRALAARPELRSAREQVAAAAELKASTKWLYYPDLRAVGTVEYNTGTQPFQPSHEEFLGLRLSWNVWDWGGTRSKVEQAEHDEARAHILSDALVDGARLDVRRHWLDARTAFDSLPAAQTQQEAAEEAYRLQRVKFDAAAATTTDVLDAEIDVARARLAAALARYDYYLALVGLARSVGDVPNP